MVNGPVRVCAACAAASIQPIADPHCPVCSQALDDSGRCANRICREPHVIERISAIATYSDPLATSIKRLKYQGKWGWALIFGRLVTGYLDAHFEPNEVDLIVPNPTWAPTDDDVPHTEAVLRAARLEDIYERWPFKPDAVLTVAGPPPKSAGKSWGEKAAKATELRNLLRLSDDDDVRDQRIIVFDDVCTTGSQLEAVAGFLHEHGARSVQASVLARTPWTGGR